MKLSATKSLGRTMSCSLLCCALQGCPSARVPTALHHQPGACSRRAVRPSEEASGGLQLEWELAMAAAWGGAASDDSEEPEEWGISGKQSNIALQQGGFDNKQDRLGEI